MTAPGWTGGERDGKPCAWAFERDPFGMGHGWCVSRDGVSDYASGVSDTFEGAKAKAERALARMEPAP